MGENDAGALRSAETCIDRFCGSLRAERNCSDHTLRAYRGDIAAFLAWCERAGYDFLSIDHRGLRLYLAELAQARYARSTVNRILSSIRAFYRWLLVEGAIQSDPASVLQGPRQGARLPRVLRPQEMARLLGVNAVDAGEGDIGKAEAVRLRDQAILEFLYACGARISEASELRNDLVDFSQCQVKVVGKGRKERIVPVHALCLDSMMRYRRLARPVLLRGAESEFFFVSTRGNQMKTDAMRKMFKQTLAQAGLPADITPHDMRHTFATDVLAGGADLRSVQEMLGHASLSTTQIYTHLTVERLRRAHRAAHPRS